MGAIASKNASARELRDGLRQRGGGEGAGCHDHALPLRRRGAHDLFPANLDLRMAADRRGHSSGKAVAVHRKRAAGRHLVGIRGPHDQRAEAAHLLMQETHGIVLAIIRAERI
jgi:hypothetical protein